MRWIMRLGVVSLNIIVFFVEEGWIIAAVALLPFWLAIIAVTILLSSFAILSSYLCGLAVLPPLIERWIEKQKEKANSRLAKVVNSAVWLSALFTAIIVSPTTSAVMLHLSGVKGCKAYAVDTIFSFISGTIWCFIYGGGILLVRKLV